MLAKPLWTSSRELEATTGAAAHNLNEEHSWRPVFAGSWDTWGYRDLAQNRPLCRLHTKMWPAGRRCTLRPQTEMPNYEKKQIMSWQIKVTITDFFFKFTHTFYTIYSFYDRYTGLGLPTSASTTLWIGRFCWRECLQPFQRLTGPRNFITICSWLPHFCKQNLLLFIQPRWQLRRTYFFNHHNVLF